MINVLKNAWSSLKKKTNGKTNYYKQWDMKII